MPTKPRRKVVRFSKGYEDKLRRLTLPPSSQARGVRAWAVRSGKPPFRAYSVYEGYSQQEVREIADGEEGSTGETRTVFPVSLTELTSVSAKPRRRA